ncbi:Golgi-associated plant pathogenesis-related protein 1 isoform X2 [Drosophila sechellia]|uniref:Golgi-associated plant pathogenesis-related protein 1 isoform X2 n=1 Tax=Drosophila sechellia TaxID=7238 RepID=UPI0013DE6369|nr:Golgi-associated plant pathogenesis-related protein 1 isoform X2 [Drosophila sechellia]
MFLLVLVIADLQKDHLNEHNRLREKHGSPPLILDDALSQGCEEYAKVLAANERLEHSSSAGQKYGENLCMRSQDPLQCVQDWYDEIEDYDFEKPQFGMSTGHFTALVWKNAKKMGFGQAKDKKGYYWVVARYYPPVNVNGQFEENVLPPNKGEGDENGQGNFNSFQVDNIPIIVMLWLCWQFSN